MCLHDFRSNLKYLAHHFLYGLEHTFRFSVRHLHHGHRQHAVRPVHLLPLSAFFHSRKKLHCALPSSLYAVLDGEVTQVTPSSGSDLPDVWDLPPTGSGSAGVGRESCQSRGPPA